MFYSFDVSTVVSTVDGISVIRKVVQGGEEGDGESVYRVYAVLKDSVEVAHFSTRGFYNSYDGIEWDGIFTTVYPRQVMVTQYFTERE